MTGRGALPRPRRAVGPLLASALGLVAWAAVAHNSGSGWVQALGCVLAGFVLVGLFGPAVATARLSVERLSGPADATVGVPVELSLSARRPLRVRALEPAGPSATLPPGGGPFRLTPARRGELASVVLAVESAAPFGLLWWSRRLRVDLARPLWVAPAPSVFDPGLLEPSGAHRGERGPGVTAPVGEVRGVRPYGVGDPRRRVHWPATAHRGELMVRELERPQDAPRRVDVVLPDDGPAGDEVAARGLATVLALLAAGTPVVLTTTEPDGSRSAPVAGRADAARRLARAVSSGRAGEGRP